VTLRFLSPTAVHALASPEAATSTGTTAVQIWTLIVAALAVIASVVAAVLLRRTGKGTVKAAEDAAKASMQSSVAAERSSAVAVASLTEAMAASANAPVEEFFLEELVTRRHDLRERLDAMWSIYFQLAAIMLTAHRKDWETDLPNNSPATLKLPEIEVKPAVTSSLPLALSSILASITALTARFEAVKATATADECWTLLSSIGVQARKGREVIDKTIGGVQAAEARVTGEIREARNTFGKWRSERHQSALALLDVGSPNESAENHSGISR
jgi:hypothetical protein